MDVVLGPLLQIMIMAIDIYIFVVVVGVVLSWLVAFNVINTYNRFVYMVVDFTNRATEPALKPIRKYVPNLGGIDITPVVLLLGLYFVQMVLQGLWMKVAY